MRPLPQWLPLAGIAALTPGCFSSNSEPPPPTPDASFVEPDAGSTPDQTAPPEAAPPEAGPDAPADTFVAEAQAEAEAAVVQPPPAVTVIVHNALGVEQGVSVVYQDAFSQVLATATTDALGSASAVVPGGTQVTAVMGTLDAPRLVTIEAVQPGDVLSVYDPAIDATNTQVAIDLAPDASPPPGTGMVYGYVGPCSVGTPPATVTLTYDCQSQGQFPVLMIAQAGADGGYADFAYTYAKGNRGTADGGTASVTLPGPWLSMLGSQTLTAVNTDAGNVPGPNYWALAFDEIGGNVVAPWTDSFSLPGTPTFTFFTHPGYAEGMQAELDYTNFAGATVSVSSLATANLGDSGTTNLDMGSLLPPLDSVALDTSNVAEPILTWGSNGGSIAGADGVVAIVSWSDSDDAGTPVNGTWTLVAPPGVRSATLPAVPSALASRAPMSTASFPTPLVAVVDADFVSGYDQLRAKASALVLPSSLLGGFTGNQAPPLPVDGTLRLTAITQAGD